MWSGPLGVKKVTKTDTVLGGCLAESECFFGDAFEVYMETYRGRTRGLSCRGQRDHQTLVAGVDLIWASHELGHCPFND